MERTPEDGPIPRTELGRLMRERTAAISPQGRTGPLDGPRMLGPEERLANVRRALWGAEAVGRDPDAIAAATEQLGEMERAHAEGRLGPIPYDPDEPF